MCIIVQLFIVERFMQIVQCCSIRNDPNIFVMIVMRSINDCLLINQLFLIKRTSVVF